MTQRLIDELQKLRGTLIAIQYKVIAELEHPKHTDATQCLLDIDAMVKAALGSGDEFGPDHPTKVHRETD